MNKKQKDNLDLYLEAIDLDEGYSQVTQKGIIRALRGKK